MRTLWLPEVLTGAGLEVIEYDGGHAPWTRLGSDVFDPRGVVWHHTATSSRWADGHVAALLSKGRRDLPGPLSQCGLDRDGVWWLIAAGRANHAGSGGWRGLVGNSSVLGLEVFNDGVGEPWTPAQYESAVIGTAAILERLGRDAGWLCGHKEWTTRKPDPRGIDMRRARAHVHARQEEDDMTPQQMEQLAELTAEKTAEKVAERLGWGDRIYEQDAITARVALRGLLKDAGLTVKHEVPDEFGV